MTDNPKDFTNLTNPTNDSDQSIDFSMVLASAVHDMKNSLGMLLNSLDELRTEHGSTFNGSPRFNSLQYEAERMHNDLVQLLGIYRLGEENLSAHLEEHYLRLPGRAHGAPCTPTPGSGYRSPNRCQRHHRFL
ncbi:hypothetical protein [Marinobacter similis]|uniref:hypothetical protein n=1 Tax=Marinobacter similis TaxID=1420916 RepID=UPI001F336F8C|nr:hypothetical protein [Marinobacter similis]